MMQKRKSQAILLYACGATWWPNFSQVQVAPPGYLNLVAIRYLQLWCQPMGPLCLWQCLSSLATVHIQERIWVVPLHCDSIIKLHTWKCKKGPNMSRGGTNASPSEYSASMPLQLHWMLNHVLEVHWYTGTLVHWGTHTHTHIQMLHCCNVEPFTQYLRPLSLATAPSPIQPRRAE